MGVDGLKASSGADMIEGAILKELKVHADERGRLFEILRSDEPAFRGFGQAYVSVCKPGYVKGWHYHRKQTDMFCAVQGTVKVVLVDTRPGSKTNGQCEDHVLDSSAPSLLAIPPGVVHGMECVSQTECMILNVPDFAYDKDAPDEYRIPLDTDELPYKSWMGKKGW
jgi:dTDP-4-dehydrorhamnose 3,5-epimerase